MITLTDSAVSHLKGLLSNSDKGDGLRLLVEKGGCAGMQYLMKVDHRSDGDEVIERDGVRLYVDEASRPFLDNSEVDYSDDLSDTGFKIRNPNAERNCGCGSSFEPATGAETTEVPESTSPPTACEDNEAEIAAN